MRVMDLPGWVPQPGGAYRPGDLIPLAAEEVTIEGVSRVMDNYVSFTCIFRGRPVSYDFWVSDQRLAAKVVKILKENIGETLLSIGVVNIPED
jgi:hypothetical protein